MYAAIHGYWCNTKTFPLTCKYCGSGIYFFQCDCGSRVLFDELGPPWPQHRCGDYLPAPEYEPTSAERFHNLQGVTESVRPKDYDLLPGMRRFNGGIDPSIVGRLNRSASNARGTMRIDPMGGAETHIGVITHASEVDIGERFSLSPDSIAARAIAGIFAGLNVAQITLLVDEFATDPDAEDLLSYTFWINPKLLPAALSAGDVVGVAIRPRDIMGVGMRWVASSLELLV